MGLAFDLGRTLPLTLLLLMFAFEIAGELSGHTGDTHERLFLQLGVVEISVDLYQTILDPWEHFPQIQSVLVVRTHNRTRGLEQHHECSVALQLPVHLVLGFQVVACDEVGVQLQTQSEPSISFLHLRLSDCCSGCAEDIVA